MSNNIDLKFCNIDNEKTVFMIQLEFKIQK